MRLPIGFVLEGHNSLWQLDNKSDQESEDQAKLICTDLSIFPSVVEI
jgi:hypothetical protein